MVTLRSISTFPFIFLHIALESLSTVRWMKKLYWNNDAFKSSTNFVRFSSIYFLLYESYYIFRRNTSKHTTTGVTHP